MRREATDNPESRSSSTKTRSTKRRPDALSQGADRPGQEKPAPVWSAGPSKINRREGPMPSIRARAAGATLSGLAVIGALFAITIGILASAAAADEPIYKGKR